MAYKQRKWKQEFKSEQPKRRGRAGQYAKGKWKQNPLPAPEPLNWSGPYIQAYKPYRAFSPGQANLPVYNKSFNINQDKSPWGFYSIMSFPQRPEMDINQDKSPWGFYSSVFLRDQNWTSTRTNHPEVFYSSVFLRDQNWTSKRDKTPWDFLHKSQVFLINHISNFNTFDAKCLDFIKVHFLKSHRPGWCKRIPHQSCRPYWNTREDTRTKGHDLWEPLDITEVWGI